MLFWARILVFLLFIFSASTLLTFGYFQLKLAEVPRIPGNKASFVVQKHLPRAHFYFEKLLARFYLPP